MFTLQVDKLGLCKVEKVSGGQHDGTAALAAPLQVPTPNEILIKHDLQCALMHPHHRPSAAQGGAACTPAGVPQSDDIHALILSLMFLSSLSVYLFLSIFLASLPYFIPRPFFPFFDFTQMTCMLRPMPNLDVRVSARLQKSTVVYIQHKSSICR